MRRWGWLATCACLLFGDAARADDPPPAPPAAPPPRTMWKSLSTARQMIDSIPIALVLDGIWWASLQFSTQFVNRTWAPPYPYGQVGHWTTHLLYGTSWTLMLALESLAVVNTIGLEWIGAAVYRIDWMLGYDLPACPFPGASGGCGVGAGDFAFLSVRPVGSRWWFEAGGGWLQQRVANDALRTLGESTWVLTPLAVTRELSTDETKAVSFKAFAGPGIYGGMHNANLHPTNRGQEFYSPPWTELYPLDVGGGPGARVEGRMTFFQQFSAEAELTVAPFVIGGPVRRVSREVAPLDFEREGMSVWRKVSAGIGYNDPHTFPFKVTLAFFAAELSDRPVHQIGYRGGMLRFDVPLKVPTR